MATDGDESSRRSLAGAGWACTSLGSYAGLVPARARRFSWLNPVPLVQSRNDRLARSFGDPTSDRRRAWMKQLGRTPGDDLLIDVSEPDRVSFLVLGDTGEGDHSQYAVVPPLLSQAPETAFAFVLSDVIYPAGGVNEYEDKFARPYKDYPGPIYAIPGNHDWYDDANGFMFWFCGAETPPPKGGSGGGLGSLVRRVLWRRAPRPDRAAVERIRMLRDSPAQRARQPGPYLAIDAGPVRLVGIDTGITGELDRDQGAWLRRMSSNSPRPKILLTGKPIYVDGKHRNGSIEGGGTIDEVVRNPAHGYIAAIGGDIHNYQRYPVRLGDGRTIQYMVSGGGGAFMHQTHSIENLDTLKVPGVREEDLRLYPLRGDSLSRYSELYAGKVGPFGRNLRIPPSEAKAIVADRLGLPRPPTATEPSARSKRAADVIYKLPGRARGALHIPFSEFLDWDKPPFFKSFLRIDARADEVLIRCFAATGCGEHEQDPPLEDSVRATPQDDGTWAWEVLIG